MGESEEKGTGGGGGDGADDQDDDDGDGSGSTRKRAKVDPPPLQDEEVAFAEGVTVWVSERGGPLCVLGQWKDCPAEYAKIGGQPSLNLACLKGHLGAASLLLKHGADVGGTEGAEQFFPLFNACQEGHHDIAAMLLDRGADVNQADNTGASSLYVACQEGHKEMAAMLLDRGADNHQADDDGWSPLRVACDTQRVELAAMLLERGADDNGSRFAAEDNDQVLSTWRAARARLANDIQVADALLRGPLVGGGLLSPHLPPTALASIVQEYVFSSPGLDRDALLASLE
jgi:hypothetical protein